MANNFYGAIGVSGGADGFLDNIDGTNLADADGTIVISSASNIAGLYVLDADSATAQSVPSIIQPDTNAGDKRWILRALQMTGINLYEPGTTNLFQFSQSAGDVIMDNTFDGGTITLRGEDTGNKVMLLADPAGALSAYYAGVVALTTAADGIVVQDTSGTTPIILLNNDAGTALGNIAASATTVSIGVGASFENAIICTVDAGVDLYYNNIKECETLSGIFKATNSLTIAATTNVTGILDEDDLVSDSAVSLATQQSIKAYVDTEKPNDNVLINGDFNIWQRGTSFPAIVSSASAADRFRYYKNGTMVHTIEQDTDVPTQSESGLLSNYSMKLDVTTADAALAANDYVSVRQIIEGYNYKQLEGNYATLSFWVKATKVGVYCVALQNSIADRSYVTEYTVNTTDTWEKKTITVNFNYTGGTWDYTNGIGLHVLWILGSGTTYQTTADTWQSGNVIATSNQVNATDSTANNFLLSQVKLEVGSIATPFISRSIEQELALCQRYYERINNETTPYSVVGPAGTQITTTSSHLFWWYGTTKRGYGTFGVSSVNDFTLRVGGSAYPISVLVGGARLHGHYLDVTNTSTGASGNACMLLTSATGTGWIEVDAEL